MARKTPMLFLGRRKYVVTILSLAFYFALLLLVSAVHAQTAAQPPGGEQKHGSRADSRETETRAYLVVPVKFRDTQQTSLRPTAEYLNLITDPRFGADIFYRVSSNGRFSLAGSQVSEPITLPKTAAEYLSHGEAWELTAPGWYSHQRLIDDLGPILEQKYDMHRFYGVVVFPNVSDKIGNGSGYRTTYRRNGDKKAASLPVIFINPGPFSLAGMVHEIGHHLDIGHLSVHNNAVKYDLGAMSFVGVFDSRLMNVTCDHIMWQKELLGWTTPEEVRTIDAPLEETIRLYPRSGDRKGLRMVKIPLERFGEYLTLEAVLPAGIDRFAGVPKYGVLAHRVNQAHVRRANLGLFPEVYLPEAQVSPSGSVCFTDGEQWSSTDGAQASFRVVKVTENWCEVRVSLKKAYAHIVNNRMNPRIELESCRLTARGGKMMTQTMKMFGPDWGGDAQVFGFGEIGDGVDIEFPSEQEGEREVLLGYTVAPDYSIVEIQINDDLPFRIDQWAPEIGISGQKSLGRHRIRKGINMLHVRIVGRNPKWSGENICYGLDCLSLHP